ncbi:hydroxymethylglutaryl-CoA lyase [uncultured Zhongshania sp.]|jgi:hydroxymethylglutaryl-CoA lyase|uniref:hydroxymethylglutaryl-CoA lyase n=1 Tax=uncultured Zhongshania sp. TaxID=1642288 RepID=UPI0025FA3633|nr:hydroxymethylglutaryl-CoA lyase [uncultured Zhongshania sp.]
MAEKIIINDVGPRDGLQNQAVILEPQQRVALIHTLIAAGVKHIEVGSFVSPAAVPAMSGTADVIAALPKGDFHFSALIPNLKGYELAKASGIDTVSLVIAASNTMNEKNIRMSNSQVMSFAKDVLGRSHTDELITLACIATAWECPFEGLIPENTVIDLCAELFAAGAPEVVLADTIGAASPGQVRSLMTKLVSEFGAHRLSCHFHDTRAMGVANVYAAVECGIRKFDSSIGGLGGCPFAPGASGNVATEDVVLMLNQMGFDTGIDLGKLITAADLVAEQTRTNTSANSAKWIKRQIEKGLL